MKTFLKTIAWIIGIPVGIVLIFAFLGFMAINYNFWPPNCNILPLKQAQRVCEFSKIEKVSNNLPTKTTFWVTIPYNTPKSDKIFLSIDGKNPVEMEKINEVSFQTAIDTKTGETLIYKYLRNSENSISDIKNISIKSLDKKIYDGVSGWNDLAMPVKFPKELMPGVIMIDTWTMNYHFNLFEDTRKNVDSSMARAKKLNSQSFGVFSFIDVDGDKNSFVLREPKFSLKHVRDNAITEAEMKKITAAAKKYGTETVIHYNIGPDFSKYISPSMNPFAVRGRGGDAANKRAANDMGFFEPKSKEWVDMWFSGLSPILVKWAKSAEAAGIDAIDITPQYTVPSFAPEEKYADEKYKEIIAAMRLVYKGKIYGSNFHNFGGITQNPITKTPDLTYINELDGLYLYIPDIAAHKGASIGEIKTAYGDYISQFEKEFVNYPKDIFIGIGVPSYEGFINGKPRVEYGDFSEVMEKGYKENWQEQADAYEAIFQALNGKTFFKGIATSGYDYDDLMAPKYADPLNNMAPTIRNKPAEAVWKKWILASPIN
jgi:hypothetical protein